MQHEAPRSHARLPLAPRALLTTLGIVIAHLAQITIHTDNFTYLAIVEALKRFVLRRR